MPRRRRDAALLSEQCARVVALLSLADEPYAVISRRLGHVNASTLNRVREGASFLDSESLAKLGSYPVRALGHPNLHWVLTGQGEPVLSLGDSKPAEVVALCTLVRGAVRAVGPA